MGPKGGRFDPGGSRHWTRARVGAKAARTGGGPRQRARWPRCKTALQQGPKARGPGAEASPGVQGTAASPGGRPGGRARPRTALDRALDSGPAGACATASSPGSKALGQEAQNSKARRFRARVGHEGRKPSNKVQQARENPRRISRAAQILTFLNIRFL